MKKTSQLANYPLGKDPARCTTRRGRKAYARLDADCYRSTLATGPRKIPARARRNSRLDSRQRCVCTESDTFVLCGRYRTLDTVCVHSVNFITCSKSFDDESGPGSGPETTGILQSARFTLFCSALPNYCENS